MRLLLLSLFAVVALSSCHLVAHDVVCRTAPHVAQPVQVVHRYYSAPPRCRMREERPGRKRRIISMPGKCPVPMRPFVPTVPPKKEILRIKQNRNNIKLYQATGTNRWVRPPLPKSTMDKKKSRRNSAGFAR